MEWLNFAVDYGIIRVYPQISAPLFSKERLGEITKSLSGNNLRVQS